MSVPSLQGERVTLRPLDEADLDPLAAIIREPSVAQWWGESDEPERLRDNLRMDGDAFVIEADGELAGWLGFVEETEPEYRSVGFDISLSERFQGKGLGPDALRTLIRWFADERGHHRFTIDPNAANERRSRRTRRSASSRSGSCAAPSSSTASGPTACSWTCSSRSCDEFAARGVCICMSDPQIEPAPGAAVLGIAAKIREGPPRFRRTDRPPTCSRWPGSTPSSPRARRSSARQGGHAGRPLRARGRSPVAAPVDVAARTATAAFTRTPCRRAAT